jgi:hypothetical protein
MRILLTTIALLVCSPAGAAAQEAVCPGGTVPVMSAGGPLCVGEIYLDGTWNDDPRDCLYGYYQGSCAPYLPPVTDLPPEAYTFQMSAPAVGPGEVVLDAVEPALGGDPVDVDLLVEDVDLALDPFYHVAKGPIGGCGLARGLRLS